MKTFGYKHKMYLIIIFGLIYNLYLYQHEEASLCEPRTAHAKSMTVSEQLNLIDSSAAETLKSLK